MTNASQYGKGALHPPRELTKTHYILGATPLPPVDWSVPYTVPTTMPVLNQQQTDSCTAHATVNYGMALQEVDNKVPEVYSRRFIYSQTVVTGGGAYIASAMAIPVSKGFASDASVPEGDYTEATLRDTSLNTYAVLESQAQAYAVIQNTHNIDYLASVVKQYHGFITGFDGDDAMFSPDGTFNLPTSQDWGHCVYVYGYQIRNGVKCLQVRNSWSSEWGTNGDGWIPESFVTSGPLFSAYVYADVADLIMPLTAKDLAGLQALEGYSDPVGVQFWTGKNLADYLAARLADKIKTIEAAQ